MKKKMKKYKFYWHAFHNKLYTDLNGNYDSYFEPFTVKQRVAEISDPNYKPESQRKLRLLLFKKVKSNKDLTKMNKKSLLALHKRECIGCCWDETTGRIFDTPYDEGVIQGDNTEELEKKYKAILEARRKAKKNVSRKVR